VDRRLALLHHIAAAIERGDLAVCADAARQFGFTRARITQILDLLLLAPDIQEAVLFLEAVDAREPVTERGLRGLVKMEEWGEQRARWK
jgi:hypothetical protein